VRCVISLSAPILWRSAYRRECNLQRLYQQHRALASPALPDSSPGIS